MRGIAYGVGVGPGDPELMTIKAVRVLKEVPVIAVPGEDWTTSAAYAIASTALPAIAEKQLVSLSAPMVNDQTRITAQQRENARVVEGFLDEGKDIAILTLGDPAIYSTFGYVRAALEDDGYEVRVISGVPSFCAAAASVGIQLAEWDESLRVISSAHGRPSFDESGTYALMKAGRGLGETVKELERRGLDVWAVERCGMEDERIWHGSSQIPADAGYLTLIIARPSNRD